MVNVKIYKMLHMQIRIKHQIIFAKKYKKHFTFFLVFTYLKKFI